MILCMLHKKADNKEIKLWNGKNVNLIAVTIDKNGIS